MKIAILGSGNCGCAMAALLRLEGHDVILIKTSNSMHNENFQYMLNNKREIRIIENEEERIARLDNLTTELVELANADIVFICIQSNYHEDLVKRVSKHIKDGQIIVFIPGYLSTAYILNHCTAKEVTIVEAQSSFIDCRIIKPGTVKISFRNVRNPIGVYPCKNIKIVKEKFDLLEFPFVYLSSVIEAALHNPNLIVHTVGAIMSIPRIEKTQGDYVMYHEVFTPSVWSILEKLDNEKMAVIEKLGFERLSYVEACKFRNTLDNDKDAKEVFFWYASMPTRAKGPVSVDTRYITEDVPQGLVLLEALAEKFDIQTPICTALIEIANAALGRNFRTDGRTPKRLGEYNIDRILMDCNKQVF